MKATKKILSLTLVLLMIFTAFSVSVNATDGDEAVLNQCISAYETIATMNKEEGDYIECVVYGEVDGKTTFRAYVKNDNESMATVCSEQVIGKYNFVFGYVVGPEDNPTGLYVLNDGSACAAKEAFDNGIITDIDTLAELTGAEPYNFTGYEQQVCELIGINIGEVEHRYNECYKHYEADNAATSDTATPDYVLFRANVSVPTGNLIFKDYGDYIIRGTSSNFFDTGYGVYFPENNTVISLDEAYKSKLDNIDYAIANFTFAELVGDVNYDKKLNIKDATLIQKDLAGITEIDNNAIVYEVPENAPAFISDFNRDGNHNIKDATAIQKFLASII